MKLNQHQLIDLAVQASRLQEGSRALIAFEGNPKALDGFLQEAGLAISKKGKSVRVNKSRRTLDVFGGPRIYIKCHHGGSINPDEIRGFQYQFIAFDEAMVITQELLNDSFAVTLSRLRS